MTLHSTTCIALLRGINVGGHNKLPMADLRRLCSDTLGWTDIQTYIQSGNLLFRAPGKAQDHEEALQAAIASRFGLDIATLVRNADEWPTLMAANPFPEASEAEPNRVMLALSRRPPQADALEHLRTRAGSGERVALSGGALWLHFPEGAGTSKITPTVLDRAAGSPVTMRNWRTVEKLAEMSRQMLAGSRAERQRFPGSSRGIRGPPVLCKPKPGVLRYRDFWPGIIDAEFMTVGGDDT